MDRAAGKEGEPLADQSKLAQTDKARFEAIMRTHGTRILRLIGLLVKDRALAEDLAQNVFVKAYQHLPRFRGESSIHTWLYRIAVNECKAHLRSWSFRKLLPHADVERESGTTVEHEALRNWQRERIVEEVLQLSPAHRQMIALHYYADLTIGEIAQVLGLREGTVRTKLHRARQELKKRLEREEGEHGLG